MLDYEVSGLKYVPVKVKTSDYEDFKKAYTVVENDGTLVGGYGEVNLRSYNLTADVTANTNGLKTATKNEDGTFSFSARANGTDSGVKDAALKKAENITTTVKEASGNYGEFLRVDLTGDGYGDLGAAMQAVKWTYYGNDSTCTNALQTYGTKFAADNWMHKSMGIQLGLTKSLRCQLPEGYDGTGYWTLTVYALGYEDFTVQFQATDANIVKPAKEEVDTTALEAVIAEAKALKESDYTPASWVNVANELEECEEMLANIDKQTQNGVDEQITHLREAIDSLVKAEFKLNAASGTLYTQDKTSTTLKVTTNLAGTVTWKSSNTKVATVDSKGVVTAKAAGTANYHCYSEWKNSNLQSNCQECNVHQQNSCHSLCWRNTCFLYTESNICNRWNSKICNKQQERCNCKLQRCCNSKESRYSSNHSYSRKSKDHLQSNC